MSNLKKKKLPLFPQIICGFVLCFTVFVFAPIDMYLLNSANFWFSLEHFVPTFLILFAIAFVALEAIFLVFRRLPKPLYLLLLAFLVGGTTCAYLQGNYLCMTNEVLGGGTPQWNAMVKPALINLFVWSAILIFFVGFMLMKPRAFLKAVSAICGLILVMEGSALVVGLINHAETDISSNYIYYSDLDEFTYSEQGDVLVFMMDTLDTRLFDRVLEEDAEYLKELDGFTYYRNASSSFRKTDPSFISMLTGYVCRNERPFFDDAAKAFEEGRFLPDLKKGGLTVNIYAGPSGLFTSETMTQVDNMANNKPTVSSWQTFSKVMLRMVGYRYAPSVLQPFLFSEYAEAFEQCRNETNDGPRNTYASDAALRRHFRSKGITIDNARRFFKFYAMQGSHTPYNLNRNGDSVESGSVDIYEQTLGSITVLSEILSTLKESDVYDNSTIIILADHGDGWICNPTFLVKYPHERSTEIIISDAPVQLLDMRATALYGAGLPYEEHGVPVHMWEGTTERERTFYAYNWAKPDGFDFYLNELTEYAVPSDATDLDAYVATGNLY